MEIPEAPAGCPAPGQGGQQLRSWSPAACGGHHTVGLQEGPALPQQGLLKSASEEPAASDHTSCVQFRKTQVHLPNSGYNPDCSGLFFLLFPDRIWACSLKGEVVCSDWPGPSGRSQETSPTSRVAQRVMGSASLS